MGFLYQGWVWPTRSMLLAHLQISDTGPKPNTRTHISAHPPRCPLTQTSTSEEAGMGSGTQRLLWVISGHFAVQSSCPLYPRKQTCAVQLGMSAMGHKRT